MRGIVSISAFAFCVTILTGCCMIDRSPPVIERGIVEIPSYPDSVTGTYLQFGTYLTLNGDGTFTAEHHGCCGTDGEAEGTWKLEGSTITLITRRRSGIATIEIPALTVMRWGDERPSFCQLTR